MCLAWLLLRATMAHLGNEKFLLALICKHDLFYYICKSKTDNMAAINDLIEKITDEGLRARISQELDRMTRQKKFGLVFEEHLPESVNLYDVPVKKGKRVTLRKPKDADKNKEWTVSSIKDGLADCVSTEDGEHRSIPVRELTVTAAFGEPIYPYLKPLDSVQNAPDSDLWHTLIEADNYHALQLLEYMYAGKVDCIYIDPPYNTGAKDWKYNNNYVDGTDAYRHSKWLSFMQRRLALAKKLLNPKDSVLIVTIDEKEYLHLGCLLEQMFPEARIQMIASQITPQGNPRDKQFCRTDEYLFFVEFGEAHPAPLPLNQYWRSGSGENSVKNINWVSLLRTGSARKREDRPMMFYPFFIRNTDEGPIIDSIGEPFFGDDLNLMIAPEGTTTIWPIGSDGELRRWQVSPSSARLLKEQGFLRLGKWNGSRTAVQYLAETNREEIQTGNIPISGYRYDGSVIVEAEYVPKFIPGTLWKIPIHDATRFGSQLLSKIFLDKRFSFPKSLYAVHDTLRFFVAEKPDAVIFDFFAGSGTTLQAVNLLNAEDGGHRRCIMVTNNEVSAEEAKKLAANGYQPGDDEWEKLGIARYVNWPRTVCSIKGVDINGNPLKGDYISDKKLPMSDGFKANAAFFKLGFLDKNAVALGRQFRELLPVLWMKADAIGPCPKLTGNDIPPYLVLPENKIAILVKETEYGAFKRELDKVSDIRTVYIVTDSDSDYRAIIAGLGIENTYQIYRDYLDNFRININR